MRHILLAVAALSSCVIADGAERKHSVNLDVKVVRSGASTERSLTTNVDRASAVRSTKTVVFQRQKSGVLELEIAVRNFAQIPDVVKVDWFFFSQDLKNADLSVLSKGVEDVVLKPGGGAKVCAVASPALSSESKRWQIDRVQTDTARVEAPVSHESEKVGRKIVGWLARVTADGTVLAFKASSPRFAIYATDDKRHQLIDKGAGRIEGFIR